MEKYINITGLGTALVTPFKDGEVDYEAYRRLVARQIVAGVDFLVPLGTTGETPCLDDEEKIKILELTAELAGGSPAEATMPHEPAEGSPAEAAAAHEPAEGNPAEAAVAHEPAEGSPAEAAAAHEPAEENLQENTEAPAKTIMAGVGTNSLKGTIANMRLLENHGVDVFLVVVPYYNKPTQRGQYEYFTAVAEESSKPIVIYNVPSRTGANMEAETALKLAEHPNIIGIKEASGNLEQIYKIIDGRPEGFVVLSGNDDQTLDIMRHGGDGVISVASNIIPPLMKRFTYTIELAKGKAPEGLSDMVKSHIKNFYKENESSEIWSVAEEMNNGLMPLFKACFIESNPIPTKAALSAMGLIENELRLPLTPCGPETMETMKSVLSDLKII